MQSDGQGKKCEDTCGYLEGAKNGGHKKPETDAQFLNKSKNAKCLKLLGRGYSLRLAAQEAGVSVSTAQKVKKIGMVAV